MRPLDMAKWGSLYLHNGDWNGQQILSEDWITQSTKTWFTPGDGYGFLWWLPIFSTSAKPYMAAGGGGQEIYVFPEQQLILVFTAGYYESNAGIEFANNFIRECIL